jgi:hypothetical protein
MGLKGVVHDLGTKRIPEEDRKQKIGIRLPQWMIDQIRETGTLQEVIEGILRKHIKKGEIRHKQ